MEYVRVKELAHGLAGFVRDCRRHIHSNPELSFQEYDTSRYITDRLTEAGISCRTIAGTGVLAKIEGTGDLSRAVVLRADTDALPIEEATGVDFVSRNKGVMHACGHDVHTAVLVGAAVLLSKMRDNFSGTVFALFQPAEELAPGGASKVLAEKPFEGYEVVAVVGEHVAPELPAGTFGFKAGRYMASSDEIRIKVHGQGGHAALSHRLKDPVVASAAIITALQQICSRNADATMPTILSIGKVIAEGATNIMPSEVYMEGTLRTMDEKWRMEALKRIGEIVHGVALAHGVTADVDIADGGYPCVTNNKELTVEAENTVRNMYGAESVIPLGLRMTAEDFGHYCERYPSLFYRIGVGYNDGSHAGDLHTPYFNPDENSFEKGVAVMSAIALSVLK